MPKTNSSAFGYWLDGNTFETTNPDPPSPEEARPFIVSAQKPSWIPLFLMVFARDAEHAKARVLAALEECKAKDYHGKGSRWGEPSRAIRLLDEIESGALTFDAHPADIAVMSRASWAGNDTVCG